MKTATRSTLMLLAIVAASLVLTGCLYSAEERLSFESTNTPVGSLTVEAISGDIYLQRDPSARRVHGTVFVDVNGQRSRNIADDLVHQVTVVESVAADGSMTLRIALPNGLRDNEVSVSLDLFVPAGIAVNAFTSNAAIQIDGLPVGTVDTTNGSVELLFTSGRATVRTNNAPVLVDAHDGDVDIRTNNASIDLYSVLGNVRAKTTNAPVACRALPYINSEIDIATTNGRIELSLPYNFGADFVATTTHGEVFLTGLDFHPTYSDVGHLEGQLYDGRGLVDLRTTNADISVLSRQ